MRVVFAFGCMEDFHFQYLFCQPPTLHLDKQVSVSDFLNVFRRCPFEIAFSIRKGENLARQTSSKDSMTMNLGKSSASPSESDSDRFCLFVFLIWRRHRCYLFFASPVLHHPPRNPTYVGNVSKGFQAVANFRFSALVTFLFSQRNWPSATAF